MHLQFDGEADFAAEGRELTPGLAALKAAANLRASPASTASRPSATWAASARSAATSAAPPSDGLIPGPRVFAAGRALTITGGHGHNVGFAREVDGADECARRCARRSSAGATRDQDDRDRRRADAGIGATFTAFTPEELEAAVDEAHTWGRRVAAHAIGAEGILDSVRAGVDSVEHCAFMTPEIAKEMKARGTYRSPTICALRGMLDHADVVPEYAVDEGARGRGRRARRAAPGPARGRDARLRHRRRHAVQPARQRAAASSRTWSSGA